MMCHRALAGLFRPSLPASQLRRQTDTANPVHRMKTCSGRSCVGHVQSLGIQLLSPVVPSPCYFASRYPEILPRTGCIADRCSMVTTSSSYSKRRGKGWLSAGRQDSIMLVTDIELFSGGSATVIIGASLSLSPKMLARYVHPNEVEERGNRCGGSSHRGIGRKIARLDDESSRDIRSLARGRVPDAGRMSQPGSRGSGQWGLMFRS